MKAHATILGSACLEHANKFMKKLLLLSLTLYCVAAAWADDGTIQWGNHVSGWTAPIYGPDPTNLTLSLTGNSPLGSEILTQPEPNNTQNYNGLLLQGSAYTFALYAGALSASSNSFMLVASTSFRTATANKLPAGLTQQGFATVPGVAVGEQALYQIRVWDNQGGTLTDWATAEAAWLSGLTAAGVTPVMTSDRLGGTDSNGFPVLPPSTTGFVGFNIHYIPEPGIFPVLALSAAGFIILWRPRKR